MARSGERRWAVSLQLLCAATAGLMSSRDPHEAAERIYQVADGLAVLRPLGLYWAGGRVWGYLVPADPGTAASGLP